MNNVVFSTRNIDDFITDVANEVAKRMKDWNVNLEPEKEPEEKLLNVEEAAKFLSLSVPTIYSKVSRRELPFMKRGKRLYFSQKGLLEYLKEGKVKSNDELRAEAEEYLTKKKGGRI